MGSTDRSGSPAEDMPRGRRAFAGPMLIGLGVLHTVATIPAIAGAVPYVRDRGVFGGIATEVPPPLEAMPALAALFSTVMGVLLLIAGGLAARLERQGLGLPLWIGPTLALTGLVGGVLMPPTGFWLVVVAGLLITFRGARS